MHRLANRGAQALDRDMDSYDRRVQTLATGLAALAGYVDAIGFIELGGYFVAFMSGNSTRLSVGLIADGPVGGSLIAGGLIATFVAGVVAGSVVGHVAAAHRRPAVLGLVAALLALAAALGAAGLTAGAIAAMVLAMGAENAVFDREGEVHIGLTYMTGALVKFGQRATAALLGGARLAWMPYLLLWLGLIAGAVTGAAVHASVGFGGLWIASAAAAGFAVVSSRV